MPLPSDEKLLALSKDLLQEFDNIFGMHPGFRPAHAKGAMLTGTFHPRAQRRCAHPCTPRAARVDAGQRAIFQFHRSAVDPGRRSEFKSQRFRPSLSPC